MAGTRRGSDGVQSLDRAFRLLELMAEAGGEVGLSRLAEASGMPVSSIHRLVRTLVARGYVRQMPSRRYALGPRLIHLGEIASRALGALARPHLTRLVDALGETTNLAVLDGDGVVYVAQVPSRHSMRMFTEVGRRVPVHCTGVGKVLLAGLTDEDAHGLLARAGMTAQTPRTVTDASVLVAQLADIRLAGYAVDDGEQEEGVRCVAVPVPGRVPFAAISVSGPEGRLTTEAVPRAVPLLRAAAAALAKDLASTDD
jgi:IclR family transcriptional regulator, acetate operon repressor